MIWAAVWAGATAGAGSSVGMEESVIAIGNSASPSSRFGPQKTEFNVRQDSGKARKDLKRERDDLRRGWRPHKNGGVEREGGGKARSLSSCRRAGLRSKSSRSKFAGGKKETNTDAKGASGGGQEIMLEMKGDPADGHSTHILTHGSDGRRRE